MSGALAVLMLIPGVGNDFFQRGYCVFELRPVSVGGFWEAKIGDFDLI